MPSVDAILGDEGNGVQPREGNETVRGTGRRRRTLRGPEPEPPEQPWYRIEREEDPCVFWVYADFDLSDEDVYFEGMRNVPGVIDLGMPVTGPVVNGVTPYERGRRAVRVTHRPILSHEDCVQEVIQALRLERSRRIARRDQREREARSKRARETFMWRLFGINACSVVFMMVELIVMLLFWRLGRESLGLQGVLVWGGICCLVLHLVGIGIRAAYISTNDD